MVLGWIFVFNEFRAYEEYVFSCVVYFKSIIELFVQSSVWEYLQIPIIALGLVGIWNLYDKLVSKSFKMENHNLSCVVCQYTFFIYFMNQV